MVMKLLRTTDTLALAGVCLCLVVAFTYQLIWGELPCALCNLQRVAFMIFGAGLLLNLRFGISPWNHVLSAAGALIGSLVALLQMFVHVLPGTPPTGSAFLGLHMYTWSYVMLTGAVVYALLSIAIYATSRETAASLDRQPGGPIPVGHTALSALFIVLVSANLVSAFLENGFHPFKAGGQQHYQMLYDGDVMKP
jgi:disulfide bond formation protein DsbB